MTSCQWDQLSTFLYAHKSKNWFKLSQPKQAYLHCAKKRLNLGTMQWETVGIEKLQEKLAKEKISTKKDYSIYHLFYEYTDWLMQGKINEDQYLVMEIHYQNKSNVTLNEPAVFDYSFQLKEQENYQSYENKLKKIFHEIRDGQYYQINFTCRWRYQIEGNVFSMIDTVMHQRDLLGAYAHFTNVPQLHKIFFSNSPECLFLVKNKCLNTYPIKGTTSLDGGLVNAKRKLSSSIKDQAELDMITDLMRNDLNKITPPDADIRQRAKWIKVPGLLHQASWISKPIDQMMSLGKIINSLFPGGSITGAPKIAASRKIKELEKSSRGFYCGSTIFHSPKHCSSSINIRSVTIETKTKTMELGAGGGITLLSQIRDEWDEMNKKKDSLLSLWENSK